MSSFTVARVTWSGPIRWLGDGRIDPDADDLVQQKGLYQVYADHVVHGPGTLLYVGAAGFGQHQKIAARLAAHWENWARHESRGSLVVHVGHVSVVDLATRTEQGARDDARLLRRVEALTIWWHSPPYNSQAKTYNLARGGGELLVQSMGARGRLAIEYSSAWPAVVRQEEPSE